MAQSYKFYPECKFSSDSIEQAFHLFETLSAATSANKPISTIFNIEHKDKSQFLNNFPQNIEGAEMYIRLLNGASFSMKYQAGHTEIKIVHPENIDLSRITDIFDKATSEKTNFHKH
jgi:hypothetical protein